MKRIKKAGMIGNKLAIEVAKRELEIIEKEKEEEEKEDIIKQLE